MDFLLRKGQPFTEEFNFKTEDGKSVRVPNARYRLIVERGSYALEFAENAGLTVLQNKILWNIPVEISNGFAYNTLYYTLYMNDTELARGVLKIQ